MVDANHSKPDRGRPVYVVDGSRTPFLKYRGKQGPFKAADLALSAAKPLLLRQSFAADEFDEVVLGCVSPRPEEVNIGRVVGLRLGISQKVPAWTVQRNCASGMQALDCAYRNVKHGYSELVLAGGVEAMSHAPVMFGDKMVGWLGDLNRAKTLGQRIKAISSLRLNYLAPVIGLLKGLTDPVVGLSMGQTAENLAHRFGIDRERMDAYALQSHQRLAHAQQSGWLDEIETTYDSKGRTYENDDGVRADSSMESLAKLKPVFDRRFGNVTAGNSAQVTDGAAILILASEDVVKRHKLDVMGRIIDSEWAGVDPAQMGLGPVHAVAPMLSRNKLAADKIDYWELNEAFAAQVLACVEAWKDTDYCKQELGLSKAFGKVPAERLNVDGGGISLGHPVGASGARIVLHLLKVMQREKGHRGVATICIGGGQGGAMLIENMTSS